MATATIRKRDAKKKDERFSIRVSNRQKEVIARAAEIKEKTISDFVLDEAYEAAQQIIAEKTHFTLSKEDWEAFCKALDAPPRSIPALRKLMTEPSVFDEQR